MSIDSISAQAVEASRQVRQDTGAQREQDRQISEETRRSDIDREVARSSDANRGQTLDITA